MAERKPKKVLHNATITVASGGGSQTFELRDVDFDQKRDEAALSIGRVIIDYIYNTTEGKRAEK